MVQFRFSSNTEVLFGTFSKYFVFVLFLPVIYDARKDVQSYLIISFNKILFYPLSIFVMLFGISALSSTPGRLKLFLIYFLFSSLLALFLQNQNYSFNQSVFF